MRSYQNFIGGEWVAATTGKSFKNLNPADAREFVAEYPASGKEDAAEAIRAAQKGFPAWAAMTPVARGRMGKVAGAELAGVDFFTFQRALGERGIAACTEDELTADLATLRTLFPE